MEQILLYIFVFFSIFVINCIGLYLYKTEKYKKIGKILFVIGFILLIMFIGFRYNVGTDYNSYLLYYNKIKYLSFDKLFSFDWELGAVFLFKILSLLFKNDFIIFFFIGLLQLYPIYRINKLYDYKFLPYSILIYCMVFLPFYFNGMRQGIAISFSLLSFYYFSREKNKEAFFFYLIGFLFHKSILLFLPYLLISKFIKEKKYNKYSTIITILISMFILFFFKDLAQSYDFSDYEYLIKNIDVKNISYMLIILYIPKLFLLLMMNKKNIEFKKYSGLYINGVIFDIIGTSARFLSRISYYFTIYEIILFPFVLQEIKNKSTRLIVKLLYLTYLIIYFVYWFYLSEKQGIFPYKTWI